MTQGELIGTYIFGSVGRGQQDGLSDLDILAVVKNGRGRVADNVVIATVPDEFKSLKASIAWYGGDRLREMFKNGELFAWHLHRETIPMFDPEGFLAKLGKPSEYREFLADIFSFRKVIIGIPPQLTLNVFNAVYEAGLFYVCLRNIAMAASWVLCEAPDFSRYSPFNLAGIDPCPISVRDYEITMACRLAGQRGLTPPDGVDGKFVLNVFNAVHPWIQELVSAVQLRTAYEKNSA
jgi:predicted nucleotidyltransferase